MPTRYTLCLNDLTLTQVAEVQAVLAHTTLVGESLGKSAEAPAPRVEAAAPKAPKQERAPKREKVAEAPAPTAATGSSEQYPLGGPVVEPITFEELKRRATLFLGDDACGGSLFVERLAEFKRIDGKPVERLSDIPPEMFGVFVRRLVPTMMVGAAPTAGAGLLD